MNYMNLSAYNTYESSFHSGYLPVLLASGVTGFRRSDGIKTVLLSPLLSFAYLCLVSFSDRLFLGGDGSHIFILRSS